MRDFYSQVAAMQVIIQDTAHAVLAASAFELVIHRLSYDSPPIRDAAGKVVIREDAYIKVCLPVPSIATARQLADSLGGSVRDVTCEWEWRGFRACDGYDPEGNVFQVREPIDKA